MPSTIIFFARVKSEYLEKWEYYSNDIEMLRRSYNDVVICNDYPQVMKSIFRNKSADVFCWWWHTSAPVVLIARALGRRVFCTGAIHMFDYSNAPDFYSRSWIYRLMTRVALRLSSVNIFISNDQYLSITSHIKVRNPVVLHSSLPPTEGLKDPKCPRSTNSAPSAKSIRFLYFSWLSVYQIERKGLLQLLDAISIFVESHDKNVKLIIGGKSDNAIPVIKSKVRSLSLENFVEYHFDVSHEEKFNLYESSDLLITPSFMEGFGNATLEAMSHGCPALVARYGASHEVVGNAGFIVNTIDAEAILEKLNLYQSFSLEEKYELRMSAFKHARNKFSFEERVNKLRALLEQILH